MGNSKREMKIASSSKDERRRNMGTVGAGFSMSLDGFIARPNDDVGRVFAWRFRGDTDLKVSTGDQDMET